MDRATRDARPVTAALWVVLLLAHQGSGATCVNVMTLLVADYVGSVFVNPGQRASLVDWLLVALRLAEALPPAPQLPLKPKLDQPQLDPGAKLGQRPPAFVPQREAPAPSARTIVPVAVEVEEKQEAEHDPLEPSITPTTELPAAPANAPVPRAAALEEHAPVPRPPGSLLRTMVGQDPPDPAFVVECDDRTLCTCLPALLCLLNHLPIWASPLTEEFVTAICARARTHPNIAQTLSSFLRGGTLAPDSPLGKQLRLKLADEPLPFTLMEPGQLKSLMKTLQNVPKGCPLTVSDNFASSLYDPLNGLMGERVKAVMLEKVFDSNARPLLLSLKFDGKGKRSTVIFKAGDDLRKDVACLHIFRFMNKLWRDEKLCLPGGPDSPPTPVQARVYDVSPIDTECGFIEVVPDVQSLTELKAEGASSASGVALGDRAVLNKLLASAAASYTGAHILGIKDRHSDNILIARNGTCFHIDFGHVLGDAVTLDTGDFAVTPDFKACLGGRWPEFVDLCVKAFAVLHKHSELVIDNAAAMLAPIAPKHQVREYLRGRFWSSTDMGEACSRMRLAVERGPHNNRTKLKNAVHAAAIAIKKRAPGTPVGRWPRQRSAYLEQRRRVAMGWMSKRGEINGSMRSRFCVLYGQPLDSMRLFVDVHGDEKQDSESSIGDGDMHQAEADGPTGGGLEAEEGEMDDIRTPSQRTSLVASSVLYYFSSLEQAEKMHTQGVATFKGCVDLSQVSKVSIVHGPQHDQYALTTATREWDFQVEANRLTWRLALLHNFDEDTVVTAVDNHGNALDPNDASLFAAPAALSPAAPHPGGCMPAFRTRAATSV